ncbi:MAG: DNA polymerase III subunit gamma/tau [Planctomycetota bacterium]
MSGYTVLATRYRPRAFGEVVGQEDAGRVLLSAIANQRAAHAYLFSGPRGVGKTSMARILAKAWNCLENSVGEPCGRCAVCRAIDEGSDGMDVVEIDGASHNKVENVRDLIDTVRFRPAVARHRVYIIDEVHMLSTSAFNALLKTLEEPPAHAKFILATTEPLKVPETIRSRCQLIDFRRLGSAEIVGRMRTICAQEAVPVPEELLSRIARYAQGGLRDALSLLDQLITFGDGQPTERDFERLTGRLAPEVLHGLVTAALGGDTKSAVAAGESALSAGARPADLLEQLAEVLEGVLVAAAGGQPADRTDEDLRRLQELSRGVEVDQVVAMLDVLVEGQHRLRQRHEAHLIVTMTVVALSRVQQLRSLAEVLAEEPAARARPAAPGRSEGSARPALAARVVPGATPAPAARPAPPRAAETARAAQAEELPAAPSASSGDFAARFIEEASRGARSLRTELQRCTEIRLEGDELVLALPPTSSPLFDLNDAALRERLVAAARVVAGRPVTLRAPSKSREPAAARPSAPPAPARARTSRSPASPLEQRILDDWPGAEPVDT